MIFRDVSVVLIPPNASSIYDMLLFMVVYGELT